MGRESLWQKLAPAAHALEERLHAVSVLCPAFRRGGLSWQQLRDLARSWGRAVGTEVFVELRNRWPFGGSVQRFGGQVVVFVDGSLDHWHRRHVLAHEVGHLVLGHYDLEADTPWFLNDSAGADEWEQEAQAFACLATRSPALPLEWFARR